jgi:hypothetical protein
MLQCLVSSSVPSAQLHSEFRGIGCDPCIPFLHSSPNEQLIPMDTTNRKKLFHYSEILMFDSLVVPRKLLTNLGARSNTSPRPQCQQWRAHDYRNHDTHPIQNSNIAKPSNSIHPSKSALRQGNPRFHLKPYSQVLTWPLEINIPLIRLYPTTTPSHLSRRSKQTHHPAGATSRLSYHSIITPHSLVRENKQCSLAQLAGALNAPSVPFKAGKAGRKGCAVVSPAFLPADTCSGWKISLLSINGRAQYVNTASPVNEGRSGCGRRSSAVRLFSEGSR